LKCNENFISKLLGSNKATHAHLKQHLSKNQHPKYKLKTQCISNFMANKTLLWSSILGKTHLPILFPLPLLAMEHKKNKLKCRYSTASISTTVSAKKYQLLHQFYKATSPCWLQRNNKTQNIVGRICIQ
jgi:hypothetical protein